MVTDEGKKAEALSKEILTTVSNKIKDDFTSLPEKLEIEWQKKTDEFKAAVEKLIVEKSRIIAQERKSALSQANYQSRQKILEATDSITAEIFKKGYETAMNRYDSDPGGSFITELAKEGIAALSGASFTIEVSKKSFKALDEDFVKSLEASFTDSKRKVSLKLESFDESLPGVTIHNTDGRVSYDNTIKDRFRRSRQRLISLIHHLLADKPTDNENRE